MGRKATFELGRKTTKIVRGLAERESLMAETAQEVVQHAIGLYHHAANLIAHGGHIVFEDEDGNQSEVIL